VPSGAFGYEQVVEHVPGVVRQAGGEVQSASRQQFPAGMHEPVWLQKTCPPVHMHVPPSQKRPPPPHSAFTQHDGLA
jgi:hypothetical protein